MHDETQRLLSRRHKVMGPHTPLFYDEPLHLVRGEGVWLFDNQGKRYLDVYNNVPHVGHCNPRVVEALQRQASTLNVHTRYLHENILDYLERLCATFAPSLDRAMLTCTGSEANELALRMARKFTGGQGIIVTSDAYHGNTEAVAELGTGFMPEARTTKRVKSFAFPDSYRGLEGVPQAQLGDAYLAQVAAAIEAFEREGTPFAGMLICPDFANEGLLNVPEGFLERAAELVHRASGVVICDEVQAGFGRTGHHMWAHQHYNFVPDIVTLGKPMGNGHPLAGVVARADIIEPFSRDAMYFNTFGGTPVSCAVGMAVLDALAQDQLLENAIHTGSYIAQGLRKLQLAFPIIGEVRERGLFFAVEIVRDPHTKAHAGDEARKIVNAMRQHGVLISAIGEQRSVLKLRPPMPFYREHADLLLSTLQDVLSQVSNQREGLRND
ncbi:MAG: aspartate aminotransferase family protein [Pseudomonadales bacterium]